jgi:hypothetical protein
MMVYTNKDSTSIVDDLLLRAYVLRTSVSCLQRFHSTRAIRADEAEATYVVFERVVPILANLEQLPPRGRWQSALALTLTLLLEPLI